MREPDATSVMGETPQQGKTVMRYVLDHVAKRGTGGDDTLAHVTSSGDGRAGDLVIPSEKRTGKLESELASLLKRHGIDASRFTVGAKGNKMHGETGLPVFDAGPDSGAAEGGAGAGTGGPGTGADTGGNADASSGGGKSDTAMSAEHGFTGVSATDYTGPEPATGTTAKDIVGKISNPFGLTGLDKFGAGLAASTIGNLAAPGLGTALGALSTGATMALNGVDQVGANQGTPGQGGHGGLGANPGGNVSAADTAGIGAGLGAATDPGAGPSTGATADPTDPILNALLRQLSGLDQLAPGPR